MTVIKSNTFYSFGKKEIIQAIANGGKLIDIVIVNVTIHPRRGQASLSDL